MDTHLTLFLTSLYYSSVADPPDDVDESVALLMQDELNAEMQVLKQQVAANRNELRRFEKRAAISRKNRKESVQELNEKIDMSEEEPVLPPDAYSFFAIADFIAHSNSCCHYPQLSFAIALSVFIFQLLTLSFLVTDYVIDFADAQNAGNRLGVPSGVDWTVQVCQLIALAITVISQDEGECDTILCYTLICYGTYANTLFFSSDLFECPF